MSPYGDPFTYCPDCGQPILGVGQHGYGICVVPITDRHDLTIEWAGTPPTPEMLKLWRDLRSGIDDDALAEWLEGGQA